MCYLSSSEKKSWPEFIVLQNAENRSLSVALTLTATVSQHPWFHFGRLVAQFVRFMQYRSRRHGNKGVADKAEKCKAVKWLDSPTYHYRKPVWKTSATVAEEQLRGHAILESFRQWEFSSSSYFHGVFL